MVRYRHNDPEALDQALSELDASEGALVITDGVFSAQGEIANLPALSAIAKKHGARMFVDDAHALGVIGPGGRGTGAHFGIAQDIDLIGAHSPNPSLRLVDGWLGNEKPSTTSSILRRVSYLPPALHLLVWRPRWLRSR